MSIFSKIGSVIGKVATTVYGIGKTALPILKALRPAVKEVDEAFVFIEGKIEEGGVEADDFLDRNAEALVTLEHVSARGTVIFQKINTIAVKLRVYSQEETPDRITESEAMDLGEELLELRALIAAWDGELETAEKALSAME